jgi:IclR family acetate operon transcriptional repressor
MRSAVKVLLTCEALASHQPVGARELARVVGEPRSSVQRALDTLEAAGWAVRTENGEWCLSTRPVVLAAHAGEPGALLELSGPALARLQAATDESVRLWARDGRHVTMVRSLESTQAVRYVGPPPGTALPLHASAAGKAVLAALPDDEVDALLVQPLDALTPQTIVDTGELRRHLEEIRALGYATTQHEARQDVGGVAAAVLAAGGMPIGALSVTLPMHRLTAEIVERYGQLVVIEARRLTTTLGGRAAGVDPAGFRSSTG